jgi:hypothetical protein
MKHSIILTLLTILLSSNVNYAHDGAGNATHLKKWTFKNEQKIKASFLFLEGSQVALEDPNGKISKYPLSSFSLHDQYFLFQKKEQIEKLNKEITPLLDTNTTSLSDQFMPFIFILGLGLVGMSVYFTYQKRQLSYVSLPVLAGTLCLIYSFKDISAPYYSVATNPKSIDSAFIAFKPNVATWWNSTYFYVESTGIPTTHSMMTGITGWQQQVPIPQCYKGSNAWSIPLNPTIATTPVPVNSIHFIRGALALAVNGIPIFNPYTNTGVDAFLDGQLDKWGGHCGRADDYHYHTAPLHLYDKQAKTLPIAYALDGFAVYGTLEPDGKAMTTLDANHGHYYNGVYHYHGTASAPYMVGNMVGKVTEDATYQIVPQATAKSPRPATNPLKDAIITGFETNATNTGYNLTYTIGTAVYKVNYSWNTNGVYTFNFINPTGTTVSTYNSTAPCKISTANNEVESTEFMVYPNPTTDEINISLENSLKASNIKQVLILNVAGQKVYQSNIFQKNISISSYSPGLYFLQLKTDENIHVKKIIIE